MSGEISKWRLCSEHGGYGFTSDCEVCRGKKFFAELTKDTSVESESVDDPLNKPDKPMVQIGAGILTWEQAMDIAIEQVVEMIMEHPDLWISSGVPNCIKDSGKGVIACQKIKSTEEVIKLIKPYMEK